MSTKRGEIKRTRAQKYKNNTAFKNDLHDKTPQQQRINALQVCTVCQRCKEVIEWKIKYKKYKPLTQAKTCVRCQQRNVHKAYHVICRDCAIKGRVCAKCLKGENEVAIETPQPTAQEQQQLQTEMAHLIKSLSERKRRAFLRYMKKGKEEQKAEKQAHGSLETKDYTDDDDNDNDLHDEKAKKTRVPHTRDELLQKIKELHLTEWDSDTESDDNNEIVDEDDLNLASAQS